MHGRCRAYQRPTNQHSFYPNDSPIQSTGYKSVDEKLVRKCAIVSHSQETPPKPVQCSVADTECFNRRGGSRTDRNCFWSYRTPHSKYPSKIFSSIAREDGLTACVRFAIARQRISLLPILVYRCVQRLFNIFF